MVRCRGSLRNWDGVGVGWEVAGRSGDSVDKEEARGGRAGRLEGVRLEVEGAQRGEGGGNGGVSGAGVREWGPGCEEQN